MGQHVRELLDDAALAPSREIDVGALVGAARARRRRRTSVAAAAVLVVLVAVSAFALDLGSDDATSVRVPVADEPSADAPLPDGWRRVASPDESLWLAVPEGWETLSLDADPSPRSVIVVGTGARTQPGLIAGCSPAENVPPSAGAWLSIYEYSPDGPFDLPGGDGATSPDGFGERPADFSGDTPTGPRCALDGEAIGELTNGADFLMFRDQGRLLLARIVVVADPGGVGLKTGREILNTLQVRPVVSSEPGPREPVVLHPGEVPTTLATGAGPEQDQQADAPQSSDEAAVRAAVEGWLAGLDGGMNLEYIEDAESIQDAIAAAVAYRVSQGITPLVARIHSVRVVAPDRAVVRYSAQASGITYLGPTDAIVVQIDGQWKVSRDTVCTLLQRANVVCPSRSE